MKVTMFYHSLLSDWNHGNAHFLRGIVTELQKRGHEIQVYEPENSWSLSNPLDQNQEEKPRELIKYYPNLPANFYDLKTLNLDKVLQNSDLVLVHEWNDHELVKRLGEHRKTSNYKLLFHDAHHRAITERESMSKYDLSNYDGVLAFGEALKNIYLQENWTKNAWTWHEAADDDVFYPRTKDSFEGDLVWIGNWGNEEQDSGLHEYLLKPVKELGLRAKVYGLNFPERALNALSDAGIEYGGWLPNYKVPEIFAKYKVTIHVPRHPYTEALRGIPTIRPFEALSCGIPLISAPWEDSENLFTPGKDFLVARNGAEMKKHLKTVLSDQRKALDLTCNGRKVINRRHTCGHRVNELEKICEELGIHPDKIYNAATSAETEEATV
jgi:spore maturation protein CgeB